MSQYMTVLVLSALIPLVCSLYPPLGLYRHARALALSIVCVLVLFGAWDVVATFRGHWHFNPNAVWDVRVINLPLEEVLFFVVIPFCCIFTWEALLYIRGKPS